MDTLLSIDEKIAKNPRSFKWHDYVTKITLLILKVFFLILGLCVTLGAESVKKHFTQAEIEQLLIKGPVDKPSHIIILAGGVYLTVLALLGLFAVLRECIILLEIEKVLGIFYMLLLTLIVGAGWTFMRIFGGETFKNALNASLHSYKENERMKMRWDRVMIKHQCCGLDNYTVFLDMDIPMPESCCRMKRNVLVDPDCVAHPTEQNSYFKTGCFDIIAKKLGQMFAPLNAFVISTAILIGIDAVATCHFIRRLARLNALE